MSLQSVLQFEFRHYAWLLNLGALSCNFTYIQSHSFTNTLNRRLIPNYMDSLLSKLLLLLLLSHDSGSSIHCIPHHLLTTRIADLLPIGDLVSLSKSGRLMSHLLGPSIMIRHSM